MKDSLRSQLPNMQKGHVWLCGAGPGDPGLISVLGLHALEQADIIVYDALVSQNILCYARDGAQQVYAGKRGGKPSPVQRDISDTLIKAAKNGQRVLRLKGGDPFLFGRGGEEALSLVYAGIPFRVVPGISSVTAGLAYAGIPLTHRDYNSSVTLLTGHDMGGAVPDTIDWEAVARGMPVIVMVMALKHMPEIARKLLECGRDSKEGVAFISDATLPSQSVRVTTLSQAAALSQQMRPPCLIVIGPVVKMRQALDWFKTKENSFTA